MVTEYIYKGFKISYKINVLDNTLYKADGAVTYLPTVPTSFEPIQFHTELDSHSGAEHEIKKLLENYVDFELKSFYEMKAEKTIGQR